MSILINPARFRLGADTAIGRLLGDEPAGLAVDFTTGQALVRDDSFPVAGFLGDANGLLTYTAPSSKYVCNAAGLLVLGTTLRPDHDPLTHEPLGVPVEEQRTNVLTQSQGFATATWTKGDATITAAATTAPDGTLTMEKLVEAATTADHYALFAPSVSVASGTAYSLSVFAKAGERAWLRVFLGSTGFGANTFAWINLATGAVGSTANSPVVVVNHVGGGIYRIVMTKTATATTSVALSFLLGTADGVSPYAGNGTSGLYLWGAQLEAGAWPSSYVPTVASQVTRAGDNLSLPAASMPLSAMAGTVVIEGRTPAGLGTQALWQTDDTTSAERFLIHRNTGGELHAVTVDGGVTQCDINLGVVANSTVFKVAFAWAAGDFAATLNGGTVGTDAAGTLPTVTTMRFGRDHSASEWNGHIEALTYLPRRATNAELQRMAT